MRLSSLFGQTLRSAPLDVEVEGHRLLLRAAYVRQLAAGIFTLMPLGLRSARKIERIIREEMDAIGGQELSMPVAQPADLWRETGRWYQIGEELLRFTDRGGRDMVLGMTHEEVVADLVRHDVRSYRQMPMLVYQIQTKFRDEPRPRAGLIRVREFVMKDSYSLDVDQAGLERQYRNHYGAYFRIFQRMGLAAVIAVRSDTGMMGGRLAHEFMFLSGVGEDTLVLCDACGYAGNLQVARFRKPEPVPEAPRAVERIATPGTTSIDALAALLDIPTARIAKAVFFAAAVAGERDDAPPRTVLVAAMVRGDMEVNETKLSNAIAARWLRPATAEEIAAVGAVPGYGSPVGLADPNLVVVVDDLVRRSPNLVAGANAEGFHLLHVDAGRDFGASHVADIASPAPGAPCADCGAPLRFARGVEVGNIFQLGTRYTDALGATFLDAEGKQRPVVMGSYGIGVGRALACVAEAHRDARGLALPITVAPYEAHLVRLDSGDAAVQQAADALYSALAAAGVETLYDDRPSSAGVKFADADLIGAPIRLTIGARALGQGGVELKLRTGAELRLVPADDAVATIVAERARLFREAGALVREVPYPD